MLKYEGNFLQARLKASRLEMYLKRPWQVNEDKVSDYPAWETYAIAQGARMYISLGYVEGRRFRMSIKFHWTRKFKHSPDDIWIVCQEELPRTVRSFWEGIVYILNLTPAPKTCAAYTLWEMLQVVLDTAVAHKWESPSLATIKRTCLYSYQEDLSRELSRQLWDFKIPNQAFLDKLHAVGHVMSQSRYSGNPRHDLYSIWDESLEDA